LLSGLVASLVSGIAAFAATWLILRNAGTLGLVQPPNARSSHTVPTPSGGGVGIVAGGIVATGFAALHTPAAALLVLVTSLIIAAIGFYDDRKPLRASLRLVAQTLLLTVTILFAVPLAPLAGTLPLPLLVVSLVLIGVYWINLFNFMDGIDGLAASQAAFMMLGAAFLAFTGTRGVVDDPNLWWLIALAAATLGFLPLNWPPAKVFMGDAGSIYLGFVIAAAALLTTAWGWLSFWQWLILGAAFITDATITLTRRLLMREKIFEAHRRHAYQALSRRWQSHGKVTLAFIVANLVWLLPLAFFTGRQPGCALALTALAYAPLALLAFLAGAGAPETEDAWNA
jgi:Fuc2NAc and GlcNAc transferase